MPLLFQALVCDKLHCPAIGGTLFIKTNGIKQDFNTNTISLLHDRKTVPATTFEATLPVKSTPAKYQSSDKLKLMSLRLNRILLPGDTLELQSELEDQSVLTEGWKSNQWPEPQTAEVRNGFI